MEKSPREIELEYAEYLDKLQLYKGTFNNLIGLPSQEKAKKKFNEMNNSITSTIRYLEKTIKEKAKEREEKSLRLLPPPIISPPSQEPSDPEKDLTDEEWQNLFAPLPTRPSTQSQQTPAQKKPPPKPKKSRKSFDTQEEDDKEFTIKRPKKAEKLPEKKTRNPHITTIPQAMLTEQAIQDGIEESIQQIKATISNLEEKQTQQFDPSRLFEIEKLEKNVTSLLSYQINDNLKKAISEWLLKIELYKATMKNDHEQIAYLLLSTELKGYNNILFEYTLSNLLALAQTKPTPLNLNQDLNNRLSELRVRPTKALSIYYQKKKLEK